MSPQLTLTYVSIFCQTPWRPQVDWCRWFMRKHLNLVPRRITGTMATPAQLEAQARIRKRNHQRLAILLDNGMDPHHLTASDEWGCHYFMIDKWRWEVRGSDSVCHFAGIDVSYLFMLLCS